jgi:hypothetical protein
MRKSPTRTPALLAANRANAQKSTGPRTPEGKNRVALSRLGEGVNARDFLSTLAKSSHASQEFSALYRALYMALLPDKTDETAMDVFNRTVLRVWTLKQEIIRWAASPAEQEAWFAKTGGALPLPLLLLIPRPGWRVRISIWVRRGRGRGHRLLQTGTGSEKGRARLHVVVTVTASLGHPLGCTKLDSLDEVVEGVAPRVVFKVKPECFRKHRDNENIIEQSRIGTPLSQGATPGERWTGTDPLAPVRRTKADRRPALHRQTNLGVPSLRPIRTFAELLALAPGQNDPSCRHVATAKGDLLSWLRPEHLAFTGPRLSESQDIESWIKAMVTKREKEGGPIPKKELLPHEIG